MAEMLTPTTFESFRAFSLDTITRIDEAVSLIAEIQTDKIPRVAIDPVIAELNWSLEQDPIAQQFAGAEISVMGDTTRSGQYTPAELSAQLVLIRKLVNRHYKKELESRICELLLTNKRLDFRKACSFYCSHLINIGYSKTFLARLVDRFFFQRDISKIEIRSLSRFFRLLDGKEREFSVYFGVSKELSSHLDGLDFNVEPIDKVSSQTQDVIIQNQNATILKYVFIYDIFALDNYAAMLAVQEILYSIRALTYLAPVGMSCMWGETAYVCRARSKIGSGQKSVRTISLQGDDVKTISGRRLRGITKHSERILHNFDEQSTERLLSSIKTAALARSASKENQLISLWSSIEVLLSDPMKGSTRIAHYSKLLIPCICLRHIRRQFVAVFEEMLISYRRSFSEILKKEQFASQNDFHTNFAAVLCLSENAHLQEELTRLCSTNPLALHRLWKMQRDYSSCANVLKAMRGHEDRVGWQVSRIYRARNHLVHAGQVPSYLDSLIMNMAEYYRAAIATIVNRSKLERSGEDLEPSDIDQIVAEIGVQYKVYKQYFEKLSKETPLQRSDLLELIR